MQDQSQAVIYIRVFDLCLIASFWAFHSGGVRSTAGFLGSTFSFKVVECVGGGFF